MNFFSPWIDPRVRLVRSGHLTSYLRTQGWREEPSSRENFFCYRHPTKQAAVFVPTPEEADDELPCIIDSVTQLAHAEGRFAGDVLDDLLTQPADEKTDKGPSAPHDPSSAPEPVTRESLSS